MVSTPHSGQGRVRLMPRSKTPPNSVKADLLEALKQKGTESNLLDARLAFMDVEGVRRYLEGMAEVDRVYPDFLPTQKSGRWSTTDPPLVNFPSVCINQGCPKPHRERT